MSDKDKKKRIGKKPDDQPSTTTTKSTLSTSQLPGDFTTGASAIRFVMDNLPHLSAGLIGRCVPLHAENGNNSALGKQVAISKTQENEVPRTPYTKKLQSDSGSKETKMELERTISTSPLPGDFTTGASAIRFVMDYLPHLSAQCVPSLADLIKTKDSELGQSEIMSKSAQNDVPQTPYVTEMELERTHSDKGESTSLCGPSTKMNEPAKNSSINTTRTKSQSDRNSMETKKELKRTHSDKGESTSLCGSLTKIFKPANNSSMINTTRTRSQSDCNNMEANMELERTISTSALPGDFSTGASAIRFVMDYLPYLSAQCVSSLADLIDTTDSELDNPENMSKSAQNDVPQTPYVTKSQSDCNNMEAKMELERTHTDKGESTSLCGPSTKMYESAKNPSIMNTSPSTSQCDLNNKETEMELERTHSDKGESTSLCGPSTKMNEPAKNPSIMNTSPSTSQCDLNNNESKMELEQTHTDKGESTSRKRFKPAKKLVKVTPTIFLRNMMKKRLKCQVALTHQLTASPGEMTLKIYIHDGVGLKMVINWESEMPIGRLIEFIELRQPILLIKPYRLVTYNPNGDISALPRELTFQETGLCRENEIHIHVVLRGEFETSDEVADV